MMTYKKCSHGDLVIITRQSLLTATSVPAYDLRMHMDINFICSHILFSRLLCTMVGRQ